MSSALSSAMGKRKRVGVLISGRGSNLQALIEAAQAPDYPAEIVLVISNRPKVAGPQFAQAAGIEALTIDHKGFADRESFEQALQAALTKAQVDIVCNAGFMRLLTAPFVTAWQGRLLNIHPSLLPAFKGLHVHERVLQAGVKVSGCTVHFVSPEMDSGAIIAQAAVPVAETDTPESLAARVLRAEHRLYPQVLKWVANGSVTLQSGRAVFKPALSAEPGGAVPLAETVADQDFEPLYSPPLERP